MSGDHKMDLIGIGELIVEIMRTEVGAGLDTPALFEGPFPSGAPAIMVSAAARAGLRCGFVGGVGADDFGKCLLDRLTADGVDLAQINRVEGQATGCAFVTYFADGSRKFLYHIGNTASGQVEDTPALRAYAAQFRHCHLMGCSLTVSEKMRDACLAVARTVKAGGGTVSFDPNLRPELMSAGQARVWLDPLIEMSDIILPSGAEACLLTGERDDAAACAALLGRGARIVAQKLGERGCRVYTREGAFAAAGFKVEAVDPTGAGDCFDGGFVAGFLQGMPLEETARLANAMGALGAARRGPMEGAAWRADVENFMQTQMNTLD